MDLSKTVGIVACNSVDYLEAVFRALDQAKIVVPLRNKEDGERMIATATEELVEPGATKGWFQLDFTPSDSDDPAQISFTSGTEGKPKGVILTHRALNDVLVRLQLSMAVTKDIREYIGVPVYHSFGYGRCRLISMVGGQGYIPEQGFNPKEISSMLSDGAINALSAVPSMLRVLLANSDIFADERLQLKWIEIGSQPMSADEKHQLRTLFPNARIVQHYGLTEASRTSLLQIDGADDHALASVGQAVGDTEIAIADNGCIKIRGPHVASALLIDGDIKKIGDDDGWFETSDLGSLVDGFLFFEGRADNLINCGGQKISAETIEAQLAQRLNIPKGVAVTRVPDTMYGEAVLLCIDKHAIEHMDKLKATTQIIMNEGGIAASSALKTFTCDELPATDTGKIQRKQLIADYQQQITHQQQSEPELAEGAPAKDRIKQLLSKSLNTNDVQDDDTLERLGADSISAVGISIALEKILGDLPYNWRELSVQQLADIAEQNAKNGIENSEDVLPDNYVKGSIDQNPKGIRFWALVKEDFATHEHDFFSQGFWAVFNHRFGNWRMSVKTKLLRAPLTILYRVHKKCVQIFCGIKLDYTVKLGRRVKLEHFGGMIVGATAIHDDVTLRQNTTLGIKDLSNLEGKPTLEKGVNVGTGAVIVGDITVGRYSVIGPNTVVDTDIPPFSIVSAANSIITTANEDG